MKGVLWVVMGRNDWGKDAGAGIIIEWNMNTIL